MSALAVELESPFIPRVLRGGSASVSNALFATLVGLIFVSGLLFALIINVATTQGAFEEAKLTREVKGIEHAQQEIGRAHV